MAVNPLAQYMNAPVDTNPLAKFMPETRTETEPVPSPAPSALPDEMDNIPNPLAGFMGDPSNPLNDHMPEGGKKPYPRIDLPSNIEKDINDTLNPNFFGAIKNVVLGGGGGSFNSIALRKKVREWDLTPEQENEVYNRFADAGMTNVAQQLEIGPRFMYGRVSAMTIGAPQVIENLTGIEKPEPLSTYGDIAEKAGFLFGVRGGMKLLGKMGIGKAFAPWIPTSKRAVLAKNMIEGGYKFGVFNMLSEHGGKSFLENAQRRGEGFLTGGALGIFFAGMGGITGESMKGVGEVAKIKGLANMKDGYAKTTAFLMRLGGNQMVTGIPAYERFKKGEETMPSLVYEVGLGLLFSMSDNPLKAQAEWNKQIQRHYKIKKMTIQGLESEFAKIGDSRKIPIDLKWAYIMKSTNIKPREQNAGAGDYMFGELLRIGRPDLYKKLKLVEGINVGIEGELQKVFGNELEHAMKTSVGIEQEKKTRKEKEVLGTEEREIDVVKLRKKTTTGKTKETDLDIQKKKVQVDLFKEKRKQTMEDIYALRQEREKIKYEASQEQNPKIAKEKLAEVAEISDQIKNMWKPTYNTVEYSTDKAVARHKGKEIGTGYYDVHGDNVRIGQIEVDKDYRGKGTGPSLVRKIIDTVMKKNKNIKNISTQVTSKEGLGMIDKFGSTFVESDTGFKVSKQEAKQILAAGGGIEANIDPKSSAFTLSKAGQDMPWLTWMPKGLAKQEKAWEVEVGGKGPVPPDMQILPMDMVEWLDKGGNWFDWFQSARTPIRPIYDLIKPAYVEYINKRNQSMDRLAKIYGGKIKPGSRESELLAQYADNKIPLEQVPEGLRDIALQRQQFYAEYADRLVESGLLDSKRVFNKDGTRKKYYHRYMDGVLEKVFQAGYTSHDYWIPGEMPMAGPLKTRKGGKQEIKYDALESDRQYIYAVEKYLGMNNAMTASGKIAEKLTGMRRQMADTYIRGMRGQPTGTDKVIKEWTESMSKGTANLLEKFGMKDSAKRLRDWKAPAFALSTVSSPVARFYYWRYVGLALDTSLKNSLQWHHAVARYGIDNVTKAFYLQHDAKYKDIIKESGILDEGIRRDTHTLHEGKLKKGVGALEHGSYAMWTMFDKNNRQVSGVAAYLKAVEGGKSHQSALTEMKNGSHETQFGYTKADSLLMDMYSPASRFILFKKWPLAKVEMIRQWSRDGHHDAILNLAMTEMVMYQTARAAGVDLGPYFSGIWSLATRGAESPAQMIPAVSEGADVVATIHNVFSPSRDGEKAKNRLIKAWQGGGNRYLGKGVELWKTYKNDWKVRDEGGKLKWDVTPKEAITGMFFRPAELSKRVEEIKKMVDIGDKVGAMRKEIVQLLIEDKFEEAERLENRMLKDYGQEYTDKYGKVIQPITANDVRSYIRTKDIPITERMRKRMPGRGPKIPAGQTYEGPPTQPSMLEAVRGY